ncbi:acyl carrier protein [Streptomyces sp. B1866]|uniref:acyl carrier protein n=1 Tax=Streptomyces sp. B1866 TaxID=3075431 RepID=UPI00288DECE7|nr:acyl carrier protein [Streptomyces sp. B1866]MDT3395875.1 acyl carrier protein [Streptomyces sp. B1866]
MDRTQISAAVQQAVVEAVGAEPEEVTPEATLLDELGAESIDLLDILFRLERSLGVRIQASQLAEYVQGGIPDEEFGDENEIITERGLAQLKTVMPQIDVDELAGRLQATQVMGLFTVDNLTALVAAQVEAGATAAAV